MKQKIYELTIPQKSILDAEFYFPEDTFQNIGGYVILQYAANLETIRKAYYTLLQKNDSLRIQLTNEDGECYQYVEEYEPKELEFYNFEGKEKEYQDFLKNFPLQNLFRMEQPLY